ncbi:hypothetical protein NEOLEDRAFT_1129423 [Neolentinus lepideus HHB14362 ss-1]|uniref:Uncharacterized protein n=1 Tax=Neolentinus lepideus HHB14362 ss-1 TaxID=1314782 RepID=A0A165URL2_9AGAM|nr:hypothetical protein NEOLEDRAFT_1129423 [Neolentinus lepideus HHB14362 ss-1]
MASAQSNGVQVMISYVLFCLRIGVSGSNAPITSVGASVSDDYCIRLRSPGIPFASDQTTTYTIRKGDNGVGYHVHSWSRTPYLRQFPVHLLEY